LILPEPVTIFFITVISLIISGIAFLVLITGLFTELYNFWPESVIYFISIAIFGSSLKTLLEYNFKKSIFKLMSGVAFLVIFVGIFTDLYGFWYGVIGAIAIGIILKQMLIFMFPDQYNQK